MLLSLKRSLKESSGFKNKLLGAKNLDSFEAVEEHINNKWNIIIKIKFLYKYMEK